ncbi:ABC transporter ATP-binding protein [Algoriphagus sp. NBT04N3]|uniref:ABC transporter ATP-binding protein n=1 Tax=Algoriphagus sp. NBT04N3 TaxID=2705473 RepID=UPI001C625321|nr:ABC transporter ATP-binding protein [Algoriphagus sp. NBT04N3]QYH37956.1 ABC transporter ATP-binding protein [Algoriphagus sp. NBT04N3]
MRPVILADNISKLYKLGEIGTGTLSHDLQRWISKARGKGDPFSIIGAENDRTSKDTKGYAWALNDISFEVNEGDVLGIIGRNGAGKSTLLKILSRVTLPSSGYVDVKGRIASLLEVGTGFHPELTGRENIFLNGAILGMKKQEIKKKFDEIVEFSGVAKYVDTPVKRYSSGMYVRLAFAVAAHLESEILIVDEVLAVGDIEFQRKCLGKMGDLSKSGRTVLFVSHNLTAVQELCSTGILLQNGRLTQSGKVAEIINSYQSNLSSSDMKVTFPVISDSVILQDFKLFPENSDQNPTITCDTAIHFEIYFENLISQRTQDVTLELKMMDGSIVFHQAFEFAPKGDSRKGSYILRGKIPGQLLNAGYYSFKLIFGHNRQYSLLTINELCVFEVENTHTLLGSLFNSPPGTIRIDLNIDCTYEGA